MYHCARKLHNNNSVNAVMSDKAHQKKDEKREEAGRRGRGEVNPNATQSRLVARQRNKLSTSAQPFPGRRLLQRTVQRV